MLPSGLCLFVCFLLGMSNPVKQYRFPVIEVDSCPTTNQSWYRAGVQLNCSYDKNNRFQYLCIPNQNKTALLEFCYDKIIRLYEKGNCLHLSNSGTVDEDSCESFKEGCPYRPYLSSNIFLYQRCLSINTQLGCFIEDPDCLLVNQSIMTQNPRNITESEPIDNNFSIPLVVTALSSIAAGSLLIGIYILLRSPRLRQRVRQCFSQLLRKDKQDRHVDVCQSMNNLCFKHHLDATWLKDGRQMNNDGKHSYKVDPDRMFIIYNVNKTDRGNYKGIGRPRGSETYPLKIDIETLHLYGPVIIYKNKETTHLVRPRPQRQSLNRICCLRTSSPLNPSNEENSKWTTIWTSRENSNKPCNVLVTKSENNLSNSTHDMFTNNAGKKLFLHVALLISKNQTLERQSNETQACLKVVEKFLPGIMENFTFDECFHEANQWVDSISISQDTVTFVNDQVEMVTLWALVQNCHMPKDVVEYIFDNRLTSLCVKYFRLQNYNRHENEACIYLPPSFEDKYLSCLIEDYISKENDDMTFLSITEIEGEYDQSSSSVFDCIMYYCFVIDKGSKKLISEYFRSDGYSKKKRERCICVPADVTRNLIKRLEIDILVHSTICDISCHRTVSEIYRVPEEILKWDLEARQRFLENFKRGNVPVYRVRCLIVGCAGTGKTTLLLNLQRKKKKKSRQSPESTKGLDVYEDLFVISSKKDRKETLYDYNKQSISNVGFFRTQRRKESPTSNCLSVMDFAGQVAYYACHQVYFSRRAIYLLVVDMSKDLNTEMGSSERHNVKGSLFEHWSSQDYFSFWIQTIRTYREDNYRQNASSPVIVIATHKDCVMNALGKISFESGDDFHKRLMRGVPKTVQNSFNNGSHWYYELELPPKKKTKRQLQAIEEVRQGIAESATNPPHWGELIPATWLQFEKIIREKKERKIISRGEMITFHVKDDDFDDMLRFYHEIGIILYFPDEHLRNTIIVDIQWFVDSFKHIITDETHVPNTCNKHALKPRWQDFNKSGMLPESLLLDMWKHEGKNNYIILKDKIIPYMEKLGIVAKIELSEHKSEPHYYVPSINKIDFKRRDFIKKGNHTSILAFHFKTFLPHFFFYRLVVALFGIWKQAGDDLLMKNAAIFNAGKDDEFLYFIVAVNKTSIQMQVYTRATSIPLKIERVVEIRKQVEKFMHEITSTFHKQAHYEIGYHCPCMSVEITDEDEESFISEKELLWTKMSEIPCPNHHEHFTVIKKEDILTYWTMGRCIGASSRMGRSRRSRGRDITLDIMSVLGSDIRIRKCRPKMSPEDHLMRETTMDPVVDPSGLGRGMPRTRLM